MKLTLFILLFLICAIISGAANASDFINSDTPQWTREDMLVRKAVQGKWYSLNIHTKQPIHSDQTYIQNYTKVKSIDGNQPVIEISQARTSLPEEYIAIPAKPKAEKYSE